MSVAPKTRLRLRVTPKVVELAGLTQDEIDRRLAQAGGEEARA